MESARSEPTLTPRTAFPPLKYLWADNETALSRKKEKKELQQLLKETKRLSTLKLGTRASGKLDVRQN